MSTDHEIIQQMMDEGRTSNGDWTDYSGAGVYPELDDEEKLQKLIDEIHEGSPSTQPGENG